MRVLFLITGLGGGGAEKVVADLADQMIKDGHQVKIAYLKGEVVVRPKNTQIELVYLGLEHLSSIFSAYKHYHALINSFQPDVIHAHMVHANIFARLSRIFKAVPKLICTAHSNNEGGKLRMLAYRYTHKLADVTTNVSAAASDNFVRLGAVPEGGIATIYNGIDLNRFQKTKELDDDLRDQLGLSPQQKVMLAVGRFHEAKDYPNLIQSIKILKVELNYETMPKLFIAGDGEQRAQIEQLIAELGLEADIQLLGRRQDIEALLSISDFFVLSSKYEGLPTVVIEAMACETFVIATDCGGSAEIMGDTGILVATENSSALAQALQTALTMNQDEINENNGRARRRVEELFSLDRSVQTWLEVYESK